MRKKINNLLKMFFFLIFISSPVLSAEWDVLLNVSLPNKVTSIAFDDVYVYVGGQFNDIYVYNKTSLTYAYNISLGEALTSSEQRVIDVDDTYLYAGLDGGQKLRIFYKNGTFVTNVTASDGIDSVFADDSYVYYGLDAFDPTTNFFALNKGTWTQAKNYTVLDYVKDIVSDDTYVYIADYSCNLYILAKSDWSLAYSKNVCNNTSPSYYYTYINEIAQDDDNIYMAVDDDYVIRVLDKSTFTLSNFTVDNSGSDWALSIDVDERYVFTGGYAYTIRINNKPDYSSLVNITGLSAQRIWDIRSDYSAGQLYAGGDTTNSFYVFEQPTTTSSTSTTTIPTPVTDTLSDVGEGTGNFINSMLNPVVNIILGLSIVGFVLFLIYALSGVYANAIKGQSPRR